MDRTASLQPLSGDPGAVAGLVADWLESAEPPPPIVVRSSGTTGRPKDVALSRRAVIAASEATAARIGGPGQWLLALPIHYVAGLQVVARSLLAGTRAVSLDGHGSLAEAFDAMTGPRRYLSIVPTQLHRLLGDDESSRALTRLDAVLLGGSAAAPDLLARARARGVPVVTTYGMSETCGGCVYDGLPLDGVSVRLEEDGRVNLAGPMLFDGYVGEPRRTAEVLRDGWFRTDDLGRLDDSGRLHIAGRIDDVANSGGVKVPLAAVERRLREHPGIREVAVLARPDVEWGQVVVAFAVAVDAGPLPPLSSLRDFVAESCPREWAPREVVQCERLPMLASGKVDRQALLAASDA